MGFRENLKSELKFSGMLVKELAEKSGVKKTSLDKYLDARNQTPSATVAVKIAQALGVSVEFLVNGEDSPKNTIQKLSDTSRLIGQLVERLDEKKRGLVLEFTKWLLSRKDGLDTI